MNNPIILHTVRFVLLVLVQVFVFNNINLFGYINPSVYLLFLILFPVKVNRSLFLFLGFILGLTMDFFNNTGGVHAAACLLAAYARPLLLKYSFGVSYEYNSLKIDQTPMGGRLSYITSMVVIHHLLLYFLEVFNLSHTLFILKSALLSSIFTILMVLVIMILFSKKQR